MRIITLFSLLFFSCFTFISAQASDYLYAISLCNQPGYHCVWTQRGQTWSNLFPDPNQRDIVMRVNRMNTRIYAGMPLAIPDNLDNVDIMDLSPMARQIPAPGRKVVIFNPQVNAFGAYDADGQLVRWGPAAGGRDWCSDLDRPCHTTGGTYTIYTKSGVNCKSSIFPIPKGGAPMPYCMFFHGGYAIHGSPEVPGFNASHGCIRVFFGDAQWLNQDFVDVSGDGYPGTKVVVESY